MIAARYGRVTSPGTRRTAGTTSPPALRRCGSLAGLDVRRDRYVACSVHDVGDDSRGSLYHHFPGKDGLFWAVLEGTAVRVGRQLAEAGRDAPDPVLALRAGCLAWIRLARDQAVRQIMLIDAPAVLGWQRWRELDERGSLGTNRAAVAYAAETGSIEERHVDAFAHIVLAAINEVALMIARANDPAEALAAGESAVAEFLDRLLGRTAAPEV